MEIVEIDVEDDSAVRQWWEVEQAVHHHDREHPLLTTLGARKSWWRGPTPYYESQPLAAMVDATMVGIVDLGFSVGDNEHLADVEIAVVPSHRRRGIGRALNEEASRRRRARGRTAAVGDVHTPPDAPPSPGLAFARAVGYDTAHVEHHLVLDLPVSPEHVDALRGRRPHGYEILTWTGPCPDHLVDPYLEMRNRMLADVPLGELDWQPPVLDRERLDLEQQRLAANYETVVAVARDAAGVLGGYSMTRLQHGRPDAWQDDTLVMPDHRGHRLGLALKLATLDIIQTAHPERRIYHTWTDPENTAMYRTNAELGYRVDEVLHEVQVSD